MTPEPHALTLVAAIDAMRSGALSCTVLTQSLLDRIDATDANVQAWAWLDRERALGAAHAIDARRALQGASMLEGVPIGVKDIVATAGMPTQMGSPIYAGSIPAHDAECIARLDRAGGMVLGKTVTTEFAFTQPGKTRNPWNAASTPGGSSSGSAAAVALGQVPAAIGTQTNGSMIRPAAYCGVVGFKPGKDVLPFAGVHRFSPTLDALGVFARTVADCALLAGALAGEGDGTLESTEATEMPPALACLPEFPWVAVSSEQREALDVVVGVLRHAGARVTTLTLPAICRDAPTQLRRIMLHEAVRELGALQDRERGRMSAKLNAALDEGRTVGDDAYADALARRTEIVAALTQWLAGFDAVLTPPAPGPAPQDLTQTGDPACCSLWSLAGFPALSLPVALAPNGLPLGTQLAAPASHDHSLLAVGKWCEHRLSFRGLV